MIVFILIEAICIKKKQTVSAINNRKLILI